MVDFQAPMYLVHWTIWIRNLFQGWRIQEHLWKESHWMFRFALEQIFDIINYLYLLYWYCIACIILGGVPSYVDLYHENLPQNENAKVKSHFILG